MSKNELKLVVFSILLLISGSLLAQRGQGNSGQGGRGQSQNQMQAQSEQPKFNAAHAIGILLYDHDRVIKKTKLKNPGKKRNVVKIISDYNQTIRELKFLHSEEFRATENYVAIKREAAKVNGDRAEMRLIQLEAVEKLNHIKDKVLRAEQVLNDKLAGVFSEKQNHKWLRLQHARKESLKLGRPYSVEGSRPQKGGGRRR